MRNPTTTLSVTKFDAPKPSLSGLGTEAVGALLSASADVVLVLDGDGVICDASSSGDLMASSGGLAQWKGKP
jgi:hypothetical protein